MPPALVRYLGEFMPIIGSDRASFNQVVPSVLLFFSLSFLPFQSSAFDNELQLGLDLAYAVELAEPVNLHGGEARIHVRYGLTDTFALSSSIGWAGHRRESENGNQGFIEVISFLGGIQYAFDVFDIIPFLELLIGTAIYIEYDVTCSFLLDLGAGLDWYWRPSFSAGFSFHYQFLIEDETLSRLIVALRFNWSLYP